MKRAEFFAIGFAALLMAQGCHKEGPAERAGEKIDNALDSSDPSAGPAQKAGEELDKAASSAKETAHKATDKAKAATDGDTSN